MRERLDQLGIGGVERLPVAGEEPDPAPRGVDQHPHAVELGLVQPARPCEARRRPGSRASAASSRAAPGSGAARGWSSGSASSRRLIRRSRHRAGAGEVLLRRRGSRPRRRPRASSAVGDGVDGEVGRVHGLQLVPGDRHRHRGRGMPPGRVGHRERLAAAVLVVVEEDLAGPPPHRPLDRHLARPLALHVARDGLRHAAGGVEVEVAHDGQVEVQAGAARRLDEGGEARAVEHLADAERQPRGRG